MEKKQALAFLVVRELRDRAKREASLSKYMLVCVDHYIIAGLVR